MMTPFLRCAMVTSILSALTAALSTAQPKQEVSPPIIPIQFAGVPNSPDAPVNPGGWLIQIARRSGLAPAGVPDLTITSSGAVLCSASEECRPTIEGRELTTLSQLVVQPWPAFGG